MSTLDALDSHDESYFASFTDLLVGILFIFIIMLMLFASNMRNQEQVTKDVTKKVTDMIKSRDIVLQKMAEDLEKLGVKVTIDEKQGILRLPDKILFERNQYNLNAEGTEALIKLAGVLKNYLPCLAKVKDNTLKEACASLDLKSPEALEAVLIEGHTDNTRAIDIDFNWTLSVNRAISVFKGLTHAQPVLDNDILNIYDVPVLAVSGYEARRPVVKKDDAAQNRRIDLRFIMRSPTLEDVESMKQAVTEP